MKHLAVLSAACLATFANGASAQQAYNTPTESVTKYYYQGQDNQVKSDWVVRAGAGVFVAPEFEGADDYETFIVPVIDVTYQDFLFFSIYEGLGFNVLNEEDFRGGMKLNYRFGRDEDEANYLRGMGDVDDAIEVGVFLNRHFYVDDTQSFDLYGDFLHDLADGHEGFLGTAKLSYNRALSPQLFSTFNISSTYADEDYMRAYFSVTGPQASRSVLSEYEAKGGFKDVSGGANLLWAFDPEWAALFNVNYKQLVGDAGNSPIVQRGSESQISGGMFVTHSF